MARRGAYAKTAAQRAKIMGTAHSVFGRSGFRNGSLRKIAEEVGLSHGAVLHHFGSKQALLTAVLEDSDQKLAALFQEVATRPLAAVAEVVNLFVAPNRPTSEWFITMAAEAVHPTHPAHAYFVRRYAWARNYLTGILAALAVDGALRPGMDPARMARMAISLMDCLQVQWLYDEDSVNIAADLAAFFQSIIEDEPWTVSIQPLIRSGDEG